MQINQINKYKIYLTLTLLKDNIIICCTLNTLQNCEIRGGGDLTNIIHSSLQTYINCDILPKKHPGKYHFLHKLSLQEL